MTNNQNRKVNFSSPDILDSDIRAVEDVIRSGWLTHGEYSKALEDLFCSFTGAKYATTVSNCTAGLHLSCIVAGFGPGDEVLVPAQTHTATSHAVELTGAKAVFVDVEIPSGNISLTDMKSKSNKSTKGIIPVHMAGYPCNMKEIMNFANDNNLLVIEDCAHSIGTRILEEHVGNFGISGNFSFYPTKQITTGEGGIVISNSLEFIEKIKTLKAFGIDTPPEMREKPGVYDVKELGYNYRMTDFQAALGVGQMKRYPENLNLRQRNAKIYSDFFSSNEYLNFTPYTTDNSYFLFQVLLDDKVDRDTVIRSLKKKGIGVSIHYATPVPLMSYYKNKYNYNSTDFPKAVKYANTSISLPVHSKLIDSDLEYVSTTLLKLLQ